MSEDLMFVPDEEPIEDVPQVRHFHGDIVRILFVAAAVLIFLTHFIGIGLPFTMGSQLLLILVLVIAAGITSIRQRWTHVLDILLGIAGTLTFGMLAFSTSTNGQLLVGDGIVMVLALIFLLALYLSIRTYRGFPPPEDVL